MAVDVTKQLFKNENLQIRFCRDVYSALNNADIIFLMTDWKEFYDIDFDIVKKNAENAIIIDGKNLLDKHYIKSCGLKYEGIGCI